MSNLDVILGSNSQQESIREENEGIIQRNVSRELDYGKRVKSKVSKLPKSKATDPIEQASKAIDEGVAVQKIAAPAVKTAYKAATTGKIIKDVSQLGIKDAVQTSKLARRAKFIKEGDEALKDTANILEEGSEFAKLGSKLGKGLGAVGGIINVGEDISSAVQGKGVISGNNLAEKVSNITGTLGAAMTFVPGGELLGGALDLVSLGSELYGEHEEKKNAPKKLDAAIKSVAKPNLEKQKISTNWSSLGVISNQAKPINSLIHESGNF